MFKISTAGWHTCFFAVVFHSVVNGFLRQGRPNQLKCICKLGNCLASAAACNKTPAFPSSLIIQWIEVGLGTTHYWRWSYGDLTWGNLKLKTLKTMDTPRKINAILLNIQINGRYELTTCRQNFTEIFLTWVKILQKVLGWGLLFWLTLYTLHLHTCIYTQWAIKTRPYTGASTDLKKWSGQNRQEVWVDRSLPPRGPGVQSAAFLARKAGCKEKVQM